MNDVGRIPHILPFFNNSRKSKFYLEDVLIIVEDKRLGASITYTHYLRANLGYVT